MHGILDHRAPGNGDVDFAALAARIPPAAARTLEINQHEPDEDVAQGLALLREVEVVG
jgi:sugar phosphate isomerase/epimerase